MDTTDGPGRRPSRATASPCSRASPTPAPSGGRRPQPAAPWTGVRDAFEFGPQAPQTPRSARGRLRPGRLADERGLPVAERLDARRPTAPLAGPVLVFLHGGAFTNGTGAVPWYHGDAFARDGCVLVTLNYRLGALGYLHLADLRPASASPARATSACSTRSPPSTGCRRTSPRSAVTPTTSPSSASRPAAPACWPCSPHRRPPAGSAAPSPRARRCRSCGPGCRPPPPPSTCCRRWGSARTSSIAC